MGTLPDLSAILSAQLGLIGGGGSSVAVPRADAIPPSNTRDAGKGKKRKRGGSGTERSAEGTSGVPPSGELQTKKKRKRTEKKSAVEGSGNLEGPTETEGENVQEEELRPEEEVPADRALGEEGDEEEAVDGQESETSLEDAGSDNLAEESEGSPLLIRGRGDEADGEEQLPAPMSPHAEVPARPNIGAVQTGTSSRGDAILRRVPGVSFPDRVDFHYEGPAPLAYVPEKCGELLRQFRGRAKPLPAVEDLVFGGEYEEAARAKLLGDSAMNIVVDKYDTALKGALNELEQAKREHAEKEEASARQLSASKANVERLNGMVTRAIARRDELKADLAASRGVIHELEQKNAELEGEKASLAASHEREMKRLRDSRILEVTKERGRVEAEMAAKANRRFARIRSREEQRDAYDKARLLHSQAFGTRKCLESLRRVGSDISQSVIEIFAEQERKYEQEAEKLKVGEIPAEDLILSPLVLDSQFVDARILASLDPYGSNAGLIDPETALTLHTPLTHPTEEQHADPPSHVEGPSTAFEGETPNRGNLVAEDNAPLLVLSDTSAEGSRRGNEGENVGMLEEVPRSDEMHVSPVARESSVRASELSALNDRESDREG
ncbi:meiosis-specific protein ASY2-like [Brassica napus]|nr:meiosis-specific protein ASY2-like [Brassica napus]